MTDREEEFKRLRALPHYLRTAAENALVYKADQYEKWYAAKQRQMLGTNASSNSASAPKASECNIPTYEKEAFLSLVHAIKTDSRLESATQKQIYQWIKLNGFELDGVSYKLPDFDTWAKYVRAGKKHTKTQQPPAEPEKS